MAEHRMSRAQIVARIRYLRDAERSRDGKASIHASILLSHLLDEVEARQIKTPQVPRLGS